MKIKSPNPKLRMIAGPNGSGKTTLFEYLRQEFSFPLGYCLNPDEIQRELREKKLYLGWQSRIDENALRQFVRKHPFSDAVNPKDLSIVSNILEVARSRNIDRLALIVCDFLRAQWVAANESFTFETVMSHPSKVDLLREAMRAGYRTYLY